jgi:DNA topoisomerase-1
MRRLSHNGVLVAKYEPKGFNIKFRGKVITLSPVQEEMAVAWVKKLGTPYVEDSAFVKNFFNDFRKALGIKEKASREDFDFSEIKQVVARERETKLNMRKEEKKALAAQRKAVRETNKEKYGYAIVDGERIEVSNYVVEPSSIFMGRGKHPLRGRWKEGAQQSDITLNLSPDSNPPPGKWGEIVWEPEYMWIARWDDKLSGKKKYVWVSENSYIRQKKEIDKFEKAKELEKIYGKIKKHIIDNLDSQDPKRKKTATVCYLVDALSIRVGDEKDEDEADTVGAATLTKKNIKIKSGNLVEFDFIGKDFVRMKKEVKMPERVVENLKEFMSGDGERMFNGIRSESVSLFLDEVAPGMSAKVFRTFHSTKAVDDYLKSAAIGKNDSEEHKKYIAKVANLQAAVVCNHKRTLPKSWKKSLQKKRETLDKLKSRIAEVEKDGKLKIEKLKSDAKKAKTAKRKKSIRERTKKTKERYNRRLEKMGQRKEKLELGIKAQKETRDYNLNTSLKSYIDPRVYKRWFDRVGFDWTKYYPKTLQRKFSWIEKK